MRIRMGSRSVMAAVVDAVKVFTGWSLLVTAGR
jgi:hypothetical protein